MKLLLHIVFFCLAFLPFSVKSQLVTSGNQSPQALVQNVLVGSGVTVSNVNYTGSAQAIGQFNSTNANVGIQEGLIMTTGTIHNTQTAGERHGPHGPNDRVNAGIDNNRPGYSLLNSLSNGGGTFNAAVLEFDFVPYSDYVEFRYVFASEEYPEYVCTDFNDVFAFFISGPGIPGRQNIALIPGTNAPVAINTVNSGSVGSASGANSSNCDAAYGNWRNNNIYYRNNGTGNSSPQNSNPQFIQYDGMTTVLTASSNVICGETYHIIIAIADVGDGIYDSGIFLEANSFSSPVTVDVSYQLSSLSFDNDYTMAEGCTDATVTLTRYGEDLSSPMTVPISVTGSATPGTDYTDNIPSSVTFASGQSQVSFTISALADGIAEGLEDIIIEFGIPDPCGGNENYTITLAIDDVAPVLVTLDDEELECPGNEITLTPTVSGGGSGYNYQWSTGETTESISVQPSVTTSYTVTVTDNCLNQSASASNTVIVPNPPPIQLNVSDDVVDPCPYIEYTFSVEAIGGSGDYTYRWSDNFGEEYGTSNTQVVKPGVSTKYYILVEDKCGEQALDSVSVTITSPPLVPYVLGDTTICLGDSALLTAGATGGFGDYYYYWPHSGETTNQVWVSPRQTGRIQVIVSDDCQTFTVNDFAEVEVVQPVANFVISSGTLFEDLPIQFQNTTIGGSVYFWEFGDGQTSTQVHGSNTYDEPGNYLITLYAENDLGCRDSITKPITITPEFYIYVPNTITPNGSGRNDYFAASTINVVSLKVRIFNRWGEELFYSDDKRFQWDGTYNGQPVPDGVYVYKLEYTSINGDNEMIYGHVNVLR